jgi:uncharacterized glyoxalase superfamily protein PhnB
VVRLIVCIDAPDAEAAATFYEQGLGFARVRRFFGGAVIEMRSGDQLVHVLNADAGTPSFAGGGARHYDRHWTPVHLDLVVDRLEAAVARATAAGARLERAIAAHAWGRIAGLSDPFGNGFCLIEPSAAGYDAVEDEK